MKRFLLRKPADTKTYDVVKGDTLVSIAAAQCPEFFAESIALLNWGTRDGKEVLRALAETVGVALSECGDIGGAANPFSLKLDPAAGVNKTILIPEKFTATGVAVETEHKIKARKSRPAIAVAISTLDKWFLPGDAETCRIGYRLEGRRADADALRLDVFGSEYCKCTDWKDTFGVFGDTAALIDTPVWSRDDLTATERGAETLQWDGRSTAVSGALLKPLHGERSVTAVFSPYTVHFRYWKNAADEDAHLVLKPFWPDWDKTGALLADTLKVKWTCRKTGGKLKRGLLTIVDKDDRAVLRRALKAGEMTDADHEFVWANGQYAAGLTNSQGGSAAIAADMPYRARIELNRGAHQEEGLSLAAMHSEVRLYVHPATLPRETFDPTVAYDHAADEASLLLSLPELNPEARELTARKDGNQWVRERLSLAGFHAGPVSDRAPDDPLKRALAEFQRSVPKRRKNAGDYARLKIRTDGAANAADKSALENMEARHKRPWFGKAADRSDYDSGDAALLSDLRDKTKTVIVWVDDRFNYTTPYGVTDPPGRTLNADILKHPTTLTPSRGTLTHQDARVDDDQRDIERPWLPFQVQPILLGRSDTLATIKDVASIPKAKLDLMRKAIGPIRIDWTFDEIDGAAIAVPEVDVTLYGASSRTKKALEWTIDNLKATHNRANENRNGVKYFNARDDVGGIRPTTTGDYYKAPFELTADGALTPWRVKDCPARESVMTVVHDDLGAKHYDKDKYEKRMGAAGLYFRPSLTAGDGYRLRAQMRFDHHGDYAFPNAPVLDKRYPRLPQVQSAGLRVWRKLSFRAYLQWAPQDSTAVGWALMTRHYAMCHNHVVHECGAASITMRPSAIWPGGANDADYRKAVLAGIAKPLDAIRKKSANIRLDDDHFWPWRGHRGLGTDMRRQFDPATQYGWAAKDAGAKVVETDARLDEIFDPLSERVDVEIRDQIEKKLGLFRGLILIEFRATPKYYYGLYDCAKCGDTSVLVEKDVGVRSRLGERLCHNPACNGRLLGRPRLRGSYTCGGGHAKTLDEGSHDGGDWIGRPCPDCGRPLAAVQAPRMRYKCSVCTFDARLNDGAAGGSHQGGACPRDGCAGVLKAVGDHKKETYACDGAPCAHTEQRINPGNAAGAANGTPHAGCLHGGSLQGTGATVDDFTGLVANADSVAHGASACYDLDDQLIQTSLGQSNGCSYNYRAEIIENYTCSKCGNTVRNNHESALGASDWNNRPHVDCPSGAPWGTLTTTGARVDSTPLLWAHESSHNRFLEHAANAPSAEASHHDTHPNPAHATDASVDDMGNPTGRAWDRACMMSYADQFPTFNVTNDTMCFCYRCVLKNRGWRLGPTPLPGNIP